MGFLPIVCFSAVNQALHTPPDRALLAMGRAAWISTVQEKVGTDDGTLAEAEKSFTMAVARENGSLMQGSRIRKSIEDLQNLMSNITKGTCRIADYKTLETSTPLWINQKATGSMVSTLNRILKSAPTSARIDQTDVWNKYRLMRDVQTANQKLIEAYEPRGGYSFKQHIIEYNSLGWFFEKAFATAKDFPPSAKIHLFAYANQMIALTNGESPIP